MAFASDTIAAPLLRLRVNARYDLRIFLSPCGPTCEENKLGGFEIRIGANNPTSSRDKKRTAHILPWGWKASKDNMFYEKGAASVKYFIS